MTKQWQPSAELKHLQQRALFNQQLRDFFASRQVMEVETPLMGHHTGTNPHIHSFETYFKGQNLFLQTSPEFCMKRLLAAGSGAIYQICKAFRQGELGRWHNPEFSILEWYQPDYDLQALMAEVDALLQCVLACPAGQQISYQQCFLQYLDLDPFAASLTDLKQIILQQAIMDASQLENFNKNDCLDILMTHLIEPQLPAQQPIFIYHYPAAQAALARITQGPPDVAERFEVYFKGLELANGYHELADPIEQRQRFEAENKQRQQLGISEMSLDENFLSALAAGLPNCSGVAVGLDRLFALSIDVNSIAETLSFDFTRA